MGISNDITLAEKERIRGKKYRVKRPPDYVDPPEVLALQKKYYERWIAKGKSPSQHLMAFALACARRVHEHPEMSNRAWVLRMRNIYVSRNAHRDYPEMYAEIVEKMHAGSRRAVARRRLAKDRRERTPFAFDESKKAGKDLPL